MASGAFIGVEIGAIGVDNYQKHLEAASAATRAFKAELDLAGKIKNPFEKATAQTAALEREMTAQQQRIGGLTFAYQKAVQEYGAHSKQAYNAQRELTNANKALAQMINDYEKLSTKTITLPNVGKFKADIDTLSAATSGFKAQFEAFQSASSKGLSGAFEKSANMSDTLTSAIKTQEATISLLYDEYDKAVREQGEFSEGALKAGANVANATTELNRMKQELKDLPNGFQVASAELKKQSDEWGNVARNMNAAAKPMWGITAAYTGGVAASVKTSMDFESQMSRVKAVTYDTTKTMEENAQNLSMLEAKARQVGRETIFTATQAAEGLELLGRAGYGPEKAIAALSPVMDLAAADGLELAEASSIVADNLNALGMESTTGNAVRLVDLLAQTSRSSNTNVRIMAESLKYAAPSFAALGWEAEDAALALGMAADYGVKGSQAGTGLRQALKNLTAGTAPVTAAMEKYGLTLDDGTGKAKDFNTFLGELRTTFGGVEVDVFDMNGELKDGETILQEYGDALPISQLEKLEAMTTIFGTRALPTMLALVNTSEQDFLELSEAIGMSEGAAREMAAAFEESAEGKWLLLKSAAQEVALSLGETLLPIVKDFLDTAKVWVDKFNGMSDGTKKFILVAGGLVAAIAPILSSVAGVANAISMWKMAQSGLMGGIGGLTKLLGGGGGLAGAIGTSGGGGLLAGIGSLATKFGAFMWPGGAIAAGVIAGGVLIYKNWDTIKEKAGELKEKVGVAWGYIKEQTGKLWDGVKEKASEVWNGLTETVSTKATAIKDAITNSAIGKHFGSMWEEAKNTVTEKLGAIKGAYDEHGGGLSGIAAGWGEAIKQSLTLQWDGLNVLTGGKLNEMKDKAKEKFGQLKEDAVTKMQDLASSAKTKFDSVKTNIQNALTSAKDRASSIMNSMKTTIQNAFTGLVNKAWSWGSDLGNKLSGGLNSAWSAVKNAASSVAGVIRSYLHFSVPDVGPLADADSYMPDFIKLLTDGMRQGMGKLSAASEGLAGAIAFRPDYTDLPNGSVTNNNMGGVSFVINAAPGQNADEIAEAVEEKISQLMGRREAVYA